jgi:CBS domain-containing protein/gamma-glutamylcysteine synthetase
MSGKTIKSTVDVKARKAFTYHLLKDIETLDHMLKNNLFPKDEIRIGAEQELAIADKKMKPTCKALDILDNIDSDLFVTELSQFNLEINLDPLPLKEGVFFKLHETLKEHLKYLNEKSKSFDVEYPLAGILPTIERKDFNKENITPFQRYLVLDEILKKTKEKTFEIRISGVDEMILKLDSILAESCNTSFQIHLQLKPDEFKEKYNWAQMISGPVLAACTNSPLLLGRELWSETRIALFQQTVDSRNSTYLLREQRPRVTFGEDWVQDCVSEIFKSDVSHYPLLITADVEEESSEALSQGKPPKLKALAMHNGNIYKWNRLCYGVSDGKPHLRIENRYIPTGPTLIDEVANVAFWVGLMNAMPEEYRDLPEMMNFKAARQNFYKAAKHGLNTQFEWFDRTTSVKSLLLKELIPLAEKGLENCGIPQDEINVFIDIVRQRVKKNKTGSEWMSKNYNRLKKHFTKRRTAYFLTQQMLRYQKKDVPIYQWRNISINKKPCSIDDFIVSDVMTSELIVVHENDPILIIKHLMQWNNLKEILVENNDHKLVGIVTLQQLNLVTSSAHQSKSVKDIMQTDVKTINPDVELIKAEEMMKKYKILALPVISDDKLVGIVTSDHLNQLSVNV